jgi:hypothetical protein
MNVKMKLKLKLYFHSNGLFNILDFMLESIFSAVNKLENHVKGEYEFETEILFSFETSLDSCLPLNIFYFMFDNKCTLWVDSNRYFFLSSKSSSFDEISTNKMIAFI